MRNVALLSVSLAALTAIVAPLGLNRVLSRADVVDVPNDRSSHSVPTVRGGGLGPLIGIIAGGAVGLSAIPIESSMALARVLTPAVLVGVLGAVEDVRGLSVSVRGAAQLLIGAAFAVSLVAAQGAEWTAIPVVAILFAATVNFTNFMDGIDGISSLHALVAGGTFALLGMAQGLDWLLLGGLLTAAVFAAFMPWNLSAPGMFLGDVGSYLLGGLLATMAISAAVSGVNPLAAAAPLVIYWTDAASTLIRRCLLGEAVFEAHRSHVYQRLTDIGLKHLTVAVLVASCSGATAVVGVLIDQGSIQPGVGIGIVCLICVLYLLLPRLIYKLRLTRPSKLALVEPPPRVPGSADWNPETWAVIGASGFIGGALVERLAARGIHVLSVPAPRVRLDPNAADGASVAAMALKHPQTDVVAGRIRGADIVVNAAGIAAPQSAASPELYGANALLPAIIAAAAARVGASRVLHLSSAAVQGSTHRLDASVAVRPFSPYSRSKALGERAVIAVANELAKENPHPDLLIVRATSVQGEGRATTQVLRRVARSRLSSVAAPGDYPSTVSSLQGLVEFIHSVGTARRDLPGIVLQPWAGQNVTQVLESIGGRQPVVLPRWLCRSVIMCGKSVGLISPRIAALTRRLELMWFGQAQA